MKKNRLTMSSETMELIRKHITKAVTFGSAIATALILWAVMTTMSGSGSPVVVVLSESMEPGFKRGDVLFLWMNKDPIRLGDIVVFGVEGRDIPIVHRVIIVHEQQNSGEANMLTKGDNNLIDDRSLYAPHQYWLKNQHVRGKAVGFLPYGGWFTILINQIPLTKYLLISTLGLLTLISRSV